MPGLREEVEAIVSMIPKSKVMTYGQIAALAGTPRSARIVGGIAHYGNPDLPWHRVVNKRGKLAAGYPGGMEGQKLALQAEGIVVDSNYYINVQKLIWWPN